MDAHVPSAVTQWDTLHIFIVLGTGSAGTSNIRRVATGGHEQEFSMDQLKVRLLNHSFYACHEKNVHIKTGNNTF